MRKVIYTCLTGHYDNLLQPCVVDKSFDYICFSNEIPEKSVGVWTIRKIPFSHKSLIRSSRYVKLLPHRVLVEYDYSIYVDANIQIKDEEFYHVIQKSIINNSLIAQVNHVVPYWDCVFEDIYHAYKSRKVSFLPAYRQFTHLKKEKMPRHYGLFENNILLRRHNDPFVIKISEEWWNEYMRYSKRDQFSLMYIYWKNHYMPDLLFEKDKCTRNVPFLEVKNHNAKGGSISVLQRIKESLHWRSLKYLSRFLDYNRV